MSLALHIPNSVAAAGYHTFRQSVSQTNNYVHPFQIWLTGGYTYSFWYASKNVELVHLWNSLRC